MPATKKRPPRPPKLNLPDDFKETLRGLLQVRPGDAAVPGSRAAPAKKRPGAKKAART
jgi:hypothetical protein